MASLMNDLLNPKNLKDPSEEISLVQTHISMVFIGDEFVYKVKKPVNFGFLDFTTLEKREYFCHQELILNRRLADELYLDVLPIYFDGQTHSFLSDKGRIVDYAVRMKKIPPERLMKNVFSRGELNEGHLKKIAEVLANFHKKAGRSEEIDKFGRANIFRVNTDENFEQTMKYIGQTIDLNDYNRIKQWTDDFYREKEPLFQERINNHWIRDCHGDLHMEHICLIDPLSIIDCIEFNDRLRYSDTFADIGFLMMDLDYWEGSSLAEKLWEFYRTRTGDSEHHPLLTFYKVYRAYVRGKVNSFQIDDEDISPVKKEEAVQIARKYFKLALKYIDE
jgi:aminoglycoside phosphotransferase family enzyme